MIRLRLALVACLLPLGALSPAAPEKEKDKDKAPEGPVSYYRDVRPVFQQHCQGCHQPAKPMGGFIMLNHADLLKAGDSSKHGIVPSKPTQSELLRQITPEAGKHLMPKNKPALAAAQVALVKRWVEEGAKDDTPPSARDTISEKNPPVYNLLPVITALDYSPDGKLLAVSGHHEVLLHKADGSGLVGGLIGLSERVQSLA